MRTLWGLLLAGCFCTPAEATLVQNFNFATGGTPGMARPGDSSIWDFTLTGLSDNGVTFDAKVTVDGSSFFNSTVNRTSQGLDTGVVAGMQSVDTLALSLAINNVSGGSITSAAFTGARLNNIGGIGQNAEFSDGGTFATIPVGANTGAVLVNFTIPHSAFSLSGSAFTLSKGFFLQGITLQVTATPEPASLGMMGVAAVVFLGFGVRRRRIRLTSFPGSAGERINQSSVLRNPERELGARKVEL